MPISYTDLVDDAEAILQDGTSNVYYEAAFIGQYLIRTLRDVAKWVPNEVYVKYELESRYGSSTSTSAGKLVDTSKVQFAAADVGKRVYNTYDKTWATIIGYTSTSIVTLSNDIFTSGEGYRIYNKNCTNKKQVNIEDVVDYVDILWVEYPVGTRRSYKLKGNILDIGYDGYIPDSDVATSDNTIHVYFNKRHKLSQLTAFAGAVDLTAGYSEGDTSMVIDGLQSAGTIEEGQEFTLPYSPQVYTVTSAATITTNEATVTFYPGLDMDIDNDAVVTITQSTLTLQLETILPELLAGYVVVSESQVPLQQVMASIATVSTSATQIGLVTARAAQSVSDIADARTEIDKVAARVTQAVTDIGLGRTEAAKAGARITQALADIASGRTEAGKSGAEITLAKADLVSARTEAALATAQITLAIADLVTARTEVDKMPALVTLAAADILLASTEIDQALADLDTGRALLNTVTVGRGGVDYLQQSQGVLATAQGYFNEAITNIRQAGGDAQTSASYIGLTSGELNVASGYLSEANAYGGLGAGELATAGSYNASTGTYNGLGSGELNVAGRYMADAIGYGNLASGELSSGGQYLASAGRLLNAGTTELQTGNTYLSQAGAYLNNIRTQLQIANSSRTVEAWGRNKIAEAKADLNSLVGSRSSEMYSRG